MPMASVGTRLVARALDTLLQLAVGAALLAAFDGGWVAYAAWLLGLAYEIGCIGAFGQTVGKRALGIRVVTDAGAPSWGAAILRAWPMLLARIPYVGWLAVLAYLRAAWDPKRQGWHDLAAGTSVVRD